MKQAGRTKWLLYADNTNSTCVNFSSVIVNKVNVKLRAHNWKTMMFEPCLKILRTYVFQIGLIYVWSGSQRSSFAAVIMSIISPSTMSCSHHYLSFTSNFHVCFSKVEQPSVSAEKIVRLVHCVICSDDAHSHQIWKHNVNEDNKAKLFRFCR